VLSKGLVESLLEVKSEQQTLCATSDGSYGACGPGWIHGRMPGTVHVHVSPTPTDGNYRSLQEARLYFTESHFPGSISKLPCKGNKAVSKGYISGSVTRRGKQRDTRCPHSICMLEKRPTQIVYNSGVSFLSPTADIQHPREIDRLITNGKDEGSCKRRVVD
jgi:hypothetical protein